ncbi:hypothetical protein Q5H92_13950 [Hymenobacter sp. M29]|uniref:DUF4397 domain-containing protein n=1 Tax=Hymenobacter mellowenesis TaxID=3063995 RepID=A0ABT9AC93_9BACT|nr:hypothetical protein [Hymenobacter sp. M29]MDO7847469.1 hypothetical protein [Hymenobacter sp. M29]
MASPLLRSLSQLAAGRRVLAVAALALSAGVSGCKNDSMAVPDTGTGYYPIAVGNSWTYAVADSTWSQALASGTALGTPSVVTVSNYQFKETITEVFTDASGQTAYRLVRSKMGPTTTSFRDDSVFVLTANANFVALNRNNAKTAELIFPVRQGRSWNLNAFNNSSNDTITAETRQYSRVGQSFTTGGGTSGLPAKAYETTVTVNNTGTATENSALKRVGYQQVFAKGVGPVLRRRFFFANFYTNSSQTVQYFPGNYFAATTRRETLISSNVR